jgi:hypothetical protein
MSNVEASIGNPGAIRIYSSEKVTDQAGVLYGIAGEQAYCLLTSDITWTVGL